MGRNEREIIDRMKWSPKQRRQYQEKCLHALLSHAMKNVPFYKKHFHQHGLSERDVRHLKDPSLLPLTSPSELEAEPGELLARGVDRKACVGRCRAIRGEHPLRLYYSDEESKLLRLAERRIEAMNGLAPRSSRLSIIPPDKIPPPAGWRARWREGRRHYVSLFETIPEQLRVLRETRPDRFIAPLWILTRLAREIALSHPLEFPPKLLMSWGEPLRSADREKIREAFGADPTDIYQTWEFGPIAAEDPRHDCLHVNFDLYFVELLRGDQPAAPGEIGEVVITSLANHTMPLVRYRIGDLASWKKSGGTSKTEHLVLEAIHGRVGDAVRLRSGGYVSSRQLEDCLDQFTNVRAYRAYLAEPRKMELHVIPDKLFQDKTAELLRRKCLELFNNQVGIELRVVRELPLHEGLRRCAIVHRPPPSA